MFHSADRLLAALKAGKRPVIRTVEGKCGQGKTYATAQAIARNWFDEHIIIVSETKALLNQWEHALTAQNVWCRAIHGDTTASVMSSVIREVIRSADETRASNSILLITWDTYSHLDPQLVRHYQVILDELPPLHKYHEFSLPRTGEILSDLFDVERYSSRLCRLVPRDRAQIARLLKEPRDDLAPLQNKAFRELLRDARHGQYDAYVFAEQYQRVVVDRATIKSRADTHKLSVLRMLTPRLICGSILLGANIAESPLHLWLADVYGARFMEETRLTSKLRSQEGLGERVELFYQLPGFAAKKSTYATMVGSQTMLAAMERQALDVFGSEPFLYVANDDAPVFAGIPNAKRIPARANGLNSFSEYHNIAILAAFNPVPQHVAMLKELGLPQEAITASAHELMYQQVMRTSARDPSATSRVRVILPDQASAIYVARAMGCDKIDQLGTLALAQKPRPFTQAERDRRAKYKKEKKSLLEAGQDLTLDCDLTNETGGSGGADGFPVYFTLHEDVETSRAHDHARKCEDLQDLISLLRRSSAVPLKTKEEGAYINAGIYDPTRTGSGYRTLANFCRASFAILDFDGGNVSPDHVILALHHDAGPGRRLPFIICNSFSRSAHDPNRFRVFVFYKRPAISLQEHQAALSDLVEQLEDAGLSMSDGKLDSGCRSGVKSFFLPCTNVQHRDMAFFHGFNTKTQFVRRHGLDPAAKRVMKVPRDGRERRSRMTSPTVRAIDWGSVEAAVMKLRLMDKDRHAPMLDLTWTLRRLGLSREQCLEQLLSVSLEAHVQRRAHNTTAAVYD